MSVEGDVHCEFIKEEVHPRVSAGGGSACHRVGATDSHVAKEIGVAEGLLGKWVKLERERQGSDDGRSDADIRAGNARLRRELAEVKMVN